MKDYSPTLASAKKQIRFKGREVTLIKPDANSADPNKPWGPALNPRDAAGAKVKVYGVNVPFGGSGNELGLSQQQMELLQGSELKFILEPGEDDPENLCDYVVLEDEGVQYRINIMERLKPGNLTLLYFVGASR